MTRDLELPMYYSRVVQIIETTRCVGKGVEHDPIRRIVEYWSFDGTLLASSDPLDDRVLGMRGSPTKPASEREA